MLYSVFLFRESTLLRNKNLYSLVKGCNSETYVIYLKPKLKGSEKKMANDRKKYDSALFLDRKQAAELLGVQVDTVTKLVKDGKIIAFRTSPRGKFHIPIAELNKLRTGSDGATAEELAAQLKAMEEGKKANQ